jgi:hypothetical protein
MSSPTITAKGEFALSAKVLRRHGLTKNARVRLVETRQGILLVPFTHEPMSPELAEDLAEWQRLGASAWERFPYEPAGERRQATSTGLSSQKVRDGRRREGDPRSLCEGLLPQPAC